jgi:hypothetical protein
MAQRDNRHFVWVLGMHHRAAGPPGRCPVQPSTPPGPDQVNVLLLLFIAGTRWSVCLGGAIAVRSPSPEMAMRITTVKFDNHRASLSVVFHAPITERYPSSESLDNVA